MTPERRQWAALSYASDIFSASGTQNDSKTIVLINPVASCHKEDIAARTTSPHFA